jgi:hypothetical protein
VQHVGQHDAHDSPQQAAQLVPQQSAAQPLEQHDGALAPFTTAVCVATAQQLAAPRLASRAAWAVRWAAQQAAPPSSQQGLPSKQQDAAALSSDAMAATPNRPTSTTAAAATSAHAKTNMEVRMEKPFLSNGDQISKHALAR